MNTDQESLQSLTGMGPARSRRAKENHIHTLEDLVRADEQWVHEVLGVSIEKAHDLRRQAEVLLGQDKVGNDVEQIEETPDSWSPLALRRDVFVLKVISEAGGRPIRSTIQHLGTTDEQHFMGLPFDTLEDYILSEAAVSVAHKPLAATKTATTVEPALAPQPAPVTTIPEENVTPMEALPGPMSDARILAAGVTTGGRPQDFHFDLDTMGLTQQGFESIGYQATLLAHEPGELDESEIAEIVGIGTAGQPVPLDFVAVTPPPGVQALRLAIRVAPWKRTHGLPAVGELIHR